MVLHHYGDKLYFGVFATMTSHLKEMAKSVEAIQGDSFLEELNKKWNQHHKSLQMIRDILMYMGSNYVSKAQKTPVYELCLNLWTENVIYSEQIKTRLSNTLWNLICREHAGEDVNRELIRNITKMLMDLGSSVCDQEFETPFLQVMTSHIRESGKQLITDPENLKDPVQFVQRLLDEKHKYDKIISLAFNNDKMFHNAVNSSFEFLINLNHRCPEYISLFVDNKLRKVLKKVSKDDIDITVDNVMMLIRYLQDKDMFEKYYLQHLAKRLLSGKLISDDAEKSLIVKLKTECGYQFTSKVEVMFEDMKTSVDTMQDFYASHSELVDGPTLTVKVLTTRFWPTQSTVTCNLPEEISELCEKFRSYYLGTHAGRKLSWQTKMGTAYLKATFRKGQRHELIVSTYQMCVLMLFNNADRLSYKEVEQTTEIPASDLKRCLQSLALVNGRNVLKKVPMSKDVSEDDVFFVNDKFSSKLYKVKIGTSVAAKESEPEKLETRQRVEEHRKLQIDAAIVRIMKSRKQLDHNHLIAEVTKQLQSRFLTNPIEVKKQLESLIERDFLERDEIDRELYRYLT